MSATATAQRKSKAARKKQQEDPPILALYHKPSRVIRSNFDPSTPWPTKTGLWCWWCCHPFDTYPVALPCHQNPRTLQYKVVGNFCSWSCAKAYNFGGMGGNTGARASMMLSIRLKVFGERGRVNIAPPRQSLKVFGGFLTIEEFRRSCNSARVILQQPPFIFFPSEFHIHELMADSGDGLEDLDVPEGYTIPDECGPETSRLDWADEASVASMDSGVSSSAKGKAPVPSVIPVPSGARKKKAESVNIFAAFQSMAARKKQEKQDQGGAGPSGA